MYALVKRNKRFWVEREGVPAYSPPDWLRPYITGRAGLGRLVDALNDGAPLNRSVVEFETACRPDRPNLARIA